jgi:hypothetical protein
MFPFSKLFQIEMASQGIVFLLTQVKTSLLSRSHGMCDDFESYNLPY